MSSVETGQMSAAETGQMSAAETGQMSAVGTREMSSVRSVLHSRLVMISTFDGCCHMRVCSTYVQWPS